MIILSAEIGGLVILFALLAIIYMPIVLITDELSYEQTLCVYTLFSIMSFIMIMRMVRIGWLLNNVGFGHRTVKKMRKISHAIQNSFTNTRLSINAITTQSNHLGTGGKSPRGSSYNNNIPSPIIPHHQVQQSSGDQKSAHSGQVSGHSGDERSTTPPSAAGPSTPLPPTTPVAQSNGNTPIPSFGFAYSYDRQNSTRSRAASDESVGRHIAMQNQQKFQGLHSMQDEQPKLFMVCLYK